MEPRLNYYSFLPHAFEKFVELEALLKKSSLDNILIHLIKIRASQLNECTFCIDMHVKEAIIDGESHLRLHHIAGWKESPLFTEKERAAFLWTEALTKLSVEATSDEVYKKVKEHFAEKELVELTVAITLINSWNRFSVAFRAVPGSMDKIHGLDKAKL